MDIVPQHTARFAGDVCSECSIWWHSMPVAPQGADIANSKRQ